VSVVALLVLLAFVYARAPDDGDAGLRQVGILEDPTPFVSVVHPVAGANVLTVSATGSVGVRNHVSLTPQVGGRVVSLSPSLRAGGSFAAGDELLVIDRRDFELALGQAQADLATAEANLLLEQAKSDAARANYDLLHPGEEAPPLVARVPQIAQAKAGIAAANARLRIAALDLERTSFSLPFAGNVTASTAEVGQVLTRGQSFGQAFALGAVEVVVPVAPDDFNQLAPAVGRRAMVRDQYRTYVAVVDRVSAELDARTRFANLYLSLADDPPAPGTFVDVEIEGATLANTFLLPEAAEQVNSRVWVVSRGVLAAVTPDTLGRTAEGWIVTAFDIRDGVVLGAVPGAREGQAVEIVDPITGTRGGGRP